jgi:hypothetical protein
MYQYILIPLVCLFYPVYKCLRKEKKNSKLSTIYDYLESDSDFKKISGSIDQKFLNIIEKKS